MGREGGKRKREKKEKRVSERKIRRSHKTRNLIDVNTYNFV